MQIAEKNSKTLRNHERRACEEKKTEKKRFTQESKFSMKRNQKNHYKVFAKESEGNVETTVCGILFRNKRLAILQFSCFHYLNFPKGML